MNRPRLSVAGALFTAAILAILLLTPRDAQAYLDPGTGSYVLQLAMAGLLASMFTLKLYWLRLKDWVRGKKPVPEDGTATQPDVAQSSAPEAKDEPR